MGRNRAVNRVVTAALFSSLVLSHSRLVLIDSEHQFEHARLSPTSRFHHSTTCEAEIFSECSDFQTGNLAFVLNSTTLIFCFVP